MKLKKRENIYLAAYPLSAQIVSLYFVASQSEMELPIEKMDEEESTVETEIAAEEEFSTPDVEICKNIYY
jgi:hypothetical protein